MSHAAESSVIAHYLLLHAQEASRNSEHCRTIRRSVATHVSPPHWLFCTLHCVCRAPPTLLTAAHPAAFAGTPPAPRAPRTPPTPSAPPTPPGAPPAPAAAASEASPRWLAAPRPQAPQSATAHPPERSLSLPASLNPPPSLLFFFLLLPSLPPSLPLMIS